jgi:hypothetical protein
VGTAGKNYEKAQKALAAAEVVLAKGTMKGEALTTAQRNEISDIAATARRTIARLEKKATPERPVRYSRSFDPGLMYQSLCEKYYRQSPLADLDAWWAGQPGTIVVIQEGKPLRYSRGSRGGVTVELVA